MRFFLAVACLGCATLHASILSTYRIDGKAALEGIVVGIELMCRLGLVAPNGAMALLPMLEAPCREDLGWSSARWADEAARYRENWAVRHTLPADNRRP